MIDKYIWQPQFTYKWISYIYPLCSHRKSYHQLLSDLRPIIVLQCRSLTDSGQTWMVWLWWMKMPTQKLSILMVMFMLTLKTAFPQFVNILMWLSDSLMIAWRQHVQCTLCSPISSTRTINCRFVGPLAPFWILKINSIKGQKDIRQWFYTNAFPWGWIDRCKEGWIE